ncbi:hypothetical protein [Kitasatospora sp. NPDC056731]|uniref:hypothetical protein n=1 Tax=Kitasatospora sp. NPDC056731 TaxID=3155422 RepID=UPI0034304096
MAQAARKGLTGTDTGSSNAAARLTGRDVDAADRALAHGDLKGSLAQLKREVQATDGDLTSLRLTGSPGELHTRTDLAWRTVSMAAALYAQRSQPPH